MIARTVTIERPEGTEGDRSWAAETGQKAKSLLFHKTENEGIQGSDRKQSGSAGLILLFAEKRPG